MQFSNFPRAVLLLGALLLPMLAPAQTVIEGRGDSAALRAIGNEAALRLQSTERRRVKLSMQSTVSAIEAVAKGEAEIALSARGPHALKEDELTLTFRPVAWDAIVLATHVSNPTPDLSLTQLRDIYLGKILRWDEVGGPARAINLYAVAGPLDGVEFGLRSALFSAGHRPVAASRWYLNTEQLEAALAIDPSGLGVTTLSNIRDNNKVRALRIQGVVPTPDTLRSGEYLLATPYYLVQRRDQPASDIATRFLQLIESPASADWLRARKLLPIRDAEPLAATFATRDAQLRDLLKVQLPASPAAAVTTALPEVAPAAEVTPTPQARL